MSKRSSKTKRRGKALPALGFAGVSLSMASGACASTGEASANTSPTAQSHEIFLGEEEIADVSLATFYVFDKENAIMPAPAQRVAFGCGCHGCGGGGCGCRGCGGGGGWGGGLRVPGVGWGGACRACAGWGGACRSCRCGGFFFRGCVGCVACGGCGGCAATCWVWSPAWGWVYSCWGSSTPADQPSRVASEQVTQPMAAADTVDGKTGGTRTK
jgi:hypothetical protein